MPSVSWQIVVGFNAQSFDTGPDVVAGHHLADVRPETAKANSGKAGIKDHHNHKSTQRLLRNITATGPTRAAVADTKHANSGKVGAVGAAGDFYYAATQAMNHQTAQWAAEASLKKHEPDILQFWTGVRTGRIQGALFPVTPIPGAMGGTLVCCVFSFNGPARSFTNSFIVGPWRDKTTAIRSYYERGNIRAADSDVQLWWGVVRNDRGPGDAKIGPRHPGR